jgi:hypothetical protein
MRHPFTTLLATVALCALPSVVISVSNGYFEPPTVVKQALVQRSLEGSSKIQKVNVQDILVERTVIIVQRQAKATKTGCHIRPIEQNSRGGLVRICDPNSRSAEPTKAVRL